MTATPAQMAAAIAEFCQTVTGLRTVTDAQSIANPPVAAVLPVTGTFIDYQVSMEHGVATYGWRLVILVSHAHDRVALPQLYGYLAQAGSTSVPAAMLSDPTLGHTVDFCVPVSATGPQALTWAGVDYLGCEIILEVSGE